ncbi:hypothetical protein ACFXGA_38360 [Actinosynnema sp. NPDC059335]|uniref:hypothetical protein n=1 Tax=Actinosynnema sp. NPDC059335 TaxID=3346804 RepID=UPI00366ACB64
MPGSPIKYDASRIGQAPADMEAYIEEQLVSQCGRDACGVRVVPQLQGDQGCISKVAPNPVPRGGTVVIYHGPDCPEPISAVRPVTTSTTTTTTTTTTRPAPTAPTTTTGSR